LRKYVEAYRDEGINIEYILPQNEPKHSANKYPTMTMSPQVEAALVSKLSQEIDQAGLNTKILIYGHNWNDVDYARTILRDNQVREKVGGVAFHCYEGNHDAPAVLANEFPEIPIFFEECTG
jgi:glucosylceramidase